MLLLASARVEGARHFLALLVVLRKMECLKSEPSESKNALQQLDYTKLHARN